VRSKVERKNHNRTKSGRRRQLTRREAEPEPEHRDQRRADCLRTELKDEQRRRVRNQNRPTQAMNEKAWQEFKSRTAAESWQQADEKPATRKSVKTEANQGLGERAERLRHR
jgi:hypothetical protein